MVVLTLVDQRLQFRHNLSIDVSRQGHIFVNFVVSFLLLSRVRNAMERYNQARDYLNTMIRETREIVAESCVLSNDNLDESASAWRHELAYRSLVLLRTALAVMDFPTKHQPVWEIPELNGFERDYVLQHGPTDRVVAHNGHWSANVVAHRTCHLANSTDAKWQASLRVPICLEYLLHTTVRSQRLRLLTPMVASHEARIYTSVCSFMTGYAGMSKFLTTVRHCFISTCAGERDLPTKSTDIAFVSLAYSVSLDSNGTNDSLSLRLYHSVCPLERRKQSARSLRHGDCVYVRIHRT
jgi:hypothetical protein